MYTRPTSGHLLGNTRLSRKFFEICGMVAKGRKSTKVAGEARASGYNIVRASKIVRFQAPKSPFPWKIVCCTHQETRNRTHTTKIRILSRATQQNEDPDKMTYSIPDILSRNWDCVRNFCESFAKVAVLWRERMKGKLR